MKSKQQLSVGIGLPFPPLPKARASSRAGTVYAIRGPDSHIYYGQIAIDQSVGFFRYRNQKVSPIEEIVSQEIMSRFDVCGIGDALREGVWLKLGQSELRKELREPMLSVLWPNCFMRAFVRRGDEVIKTTFIDDPEIQNLEIAAFYGADARALGRVMMDFNDCNDWSAGGLVWKERIEKQENARKYPDLPWYKLPKDWVYVERPE